MLCKAMLLAVLFKQVFIVCTIRASQIGYFETLQSQHCGKKEKNRTVSTLFSTMYARVILFSLAFSFLHFCCIDLKSVCSQCDLVKKKQK